jgi:hypothetical protein
MLARNDEAAGARAAVQSVEDRFNRWLQYPIVFLNDQPWSQEFVRDLTNVSSGEVFFEQVPKHLGDFRISWGIARKKTPGGVFGSKENRAFRTVIKRATLI